MAQGLRTRIIASRLTITPNTIRTHVQHILKKLKAKNKVEAIVIAIEQILNQSSFLSKS
jgi:DNA-binding NarL/FixJ family response regulator